MILFFGTYTRRASEGIYAADFDTVKGKLQNPRLIAHEPSPTYLAFSKKGQLYSVGAEKDQGGIAAYTPELQLLNHVVAPGAPVCYVAVDDQRQLVYGANYHKGQVLVYRKEENGALTLADCVTHTGSGPHENQTSAHVHYTDLTPDRYLVTCDLGCDRVVTYDVSPQGKLTQIASYQATPGAGPRHLVFHPTAKLAYLICELNSTIEVLIYDGLGQFEHMQTISTLPEDYIGENATAAIRISQDGKFLYASNRGHDSIALYQIVADASLTFLATYPSQGKCPRDFILTPDQGHLIVAHQDSDNITVFSRDSQTGHLQLLSHDFTIPEAVCLVAN